MVRIVPSENNECLFLPAKSTLDSPFLHSRRWGITLLDSPNTKQDTSNPHCLLDLESSFQSQRCAFHNKGREDGSSCLVVPLF